ncbi:hypothetical protein VFPPC_13201 [Pochonia chlamydosporia 170]|uniref:Uncharacterized protein n=1 Tax=Pochonia chlamydosporia 170 TaxID=1380566 RepID=A0A179F6N9_METCM|nr:hypothetical protein VFPPC_13201 [Pochonia chlamydosporia 170]OAQ61057.1 hypothetical protein VFPPC_13201 [Pochonia chlamydosporia 170]
MLKLTTYSALAFHLAQSGPVPSPEPKALSSVQARGMDNWQATLSPDTRQRLQVAQEHQNDVSLPGQAFRNDTIMRINIEREALDLSLIDLSQAFGMKLPVPRESVSGGRICKRSNDEEFREDMYLRGGSMYWTNEDQPVAKRSNDEEFRENMYLRSNAMYWSNDNDKRSNDEEFREDMYLRSGAMHWTNDNDKRSVDLYNSLANRNNLALGAIERVNIANRVLGKPEITMDNAKEMQSKGDEFVTGYWGSSMKHGDFWADDQVTGKPNFIEGGQVNGFGFTQSSFHKLHCLANLRMMLAWHITGNGPKMTRDMNVHAMHCLEYLRGRELRNPDLKEEPIDTVDYKGMGIH